MASVPLIGRHQAHLPNKNGGINRLNSSDEGANVNLPESEKVSSKHKKSSVIRFVILATFVCVWICFYLVVHHTQTPDNKVRTNSALRILSVEVIKILISGQLYARQYGLSKLMSFLYFSPNLKSLLASYMPIAILYALYNNLMFANLKSNHPTIYLVLSSSRLLMTAVIWQIIFKVKISGLRKIALTIITLGVIWKDLFSDGGGNSSIQENVETNKDSSGSYIAAFLVMFQMSCSVMASVYNEKLLKNSNFDPHLQNISLYLNSIFLNFLISAFFMMKGGDLDFSSSARSLLSPSSIATVMLLAIAGLMSSMLLRHENSVTKGVASSSETGILTAIEYYLYGYTLMVSEMVAIVLISIGTILYSCSPSDHVSDDDGKSDEIKLLETKREENKENNSVV